MFNAKFVLIVETGSCHWVKQYVVSAPDSAPLSDRRVLDEMATYFFKYASILVALVVGLYATLLGLLTTSTFQSNVVYLHAIQMTWFKDLNIPENFGFLKNQVTPFSITTSDSERLYAWHILPVELYRKHELLLVGEPTSFVSDITSRLAFQLLRDDPDARLILHMHGAGGTVGSGYRVPNYRALSAGQPERIHVLAFDYRGFGRSTGTPSESGLIVDALAVVDWAMNVAEIPPSRIMIFAQSMGTAVSIAVSRHLALQSPPVVFAGTVLVAPFVDVATLVATYRVAGTVPILSPLARMPLLFNYLQRFIRDKWLSKDHIAQYVRANEASGERYRLTIIHAEDDCYIPWHHSSALFWHAVNASVSVEISYDDLALKKRESKMHLDAAGSVMEWRTDNGVIREEILKTGLHDVIMGYPVITMAVMRSFEAVDPAELENINKEGKTPLMVAISYGHGSIAAYLIAAGASVIARDNEGISVLDVAKSTMEELEWATKKHSSTGPGKKQGITFVQSGAGRASKEKTFAYLNRGSRFEDVFAICGYSQVEFGGVDGCLNREEWTAKVFMFSKAVGHSLKVWQEMDKNRRPGSYYACRAEKQVIAYFLWKHTTLQEELTDGSDEELEERTLKLKDLETSKPAVLRMKKDIYDQCVDCKAFQQRVKEMTGIGFNIIILTPDKPA
ncbi:hypothetical protein V500_04183 [Pseudogymnoascus sp. VKM F-4518 (FW-2643)]|nr:hypothetical protein V500_04183 [Pseudogymnoascus sp. VKM F-4518 (FW-2643)]